MRFLKPYYFWPQVPLLLLCIMNKTCEKWGIYAAICLLLISVFSIGALALSAIPPFSGFYSKDAIIESVYNSQIFGADYAYFCLLLGAFFTALYTFRLVFLVFHTKERFG